MGTLADTVYKVVVVLLTVGVVLSAQTRMVLTEGIFPLFLVVVLLIQGIDMEIVDVKVFWPEVADDLSLVKWSHATNSKDMLDTAIEDDTMMIEADVSIGEGGVPIMAHPPVDTSDITLQQFMNSLITAVNKGKKKGGKLDFKFTDIVAPSLQILKSLEDQFNFPVWLNADVLQGTGGTSTPVDADTFLTQTTENFPKATLSLGYTTSAEGKYTEDQINQMVNLLKSKGILSPVTLLVRASLAARSLKEIKQFLLLADAEGSFPATLTIWSGAQDTVDHGNLDKLISEVGKKRVYMDVPWSLTSAGSSISNVSVATILTSVLACLLMVF